MHTMESECQQHEKATQQESNALTLSQKYKYRYNYQTERNIKLRKLEAETLQIEISNVEKILNLLKSEKYQVVAEKLRRDLVIKAQMAMMIEDTFVNKWEIYKNGEYLNFDQLLDFHDINMDTIGKEKKEKLIYELVLLAQKNHYNLSEPSMLMRPSFERVFSPEFVEYCGDQIQHLKN